MAGVVLLLSSDWHVLEKLIIATDFARFLLLLNHKLLLGLLNEVLLVHELVLEPLVQPLAIGGVVVGERGW